jgi:hypothetical protein
LGGDVDREDVTPDNTAARRVSVFTAFEGRRTDSLGRDLDPFLELLEAVALAGLVLILRDLAALDARPEAFFVDFNLGFVFVAIRAATYTGNVF